MKTINTKLMASIDEITRNPEQPRTYFAADELDRLGVSLAKRQQQPLTVIPFTDAKRPKIRWMINDGERRFRAAQKAGIKQLWIVVDDVGGGAELHTASFAANWNRAGHTHAETAAAIDREVKTGKSYKEIADIVGKTAQWAHNEHSLLKLDPDLLRLLDPPTPKTERLPSKHAYLLATYPIDRQKKIWAKYKNKSATDAFHHMRVDAPTKNGRSAADDQAYITRRAKMAEGICKGIATLPDAMVGRLTSEQRAKVAASLRALAKQAGETAELIAPLEHDDEE